MVASWSGKPDSDGSGEDAYDSFGLSVSVNQPHKLQILKAVLQGNTIQQHGTA